MRTLFVAGIVIGILAALTANAAEPSGAEYAVDESNDPLILSFSLYLKTDGNPGDAPWDLYHVYAGTQDEQGKQIQRIEFNMSYSGWVYMTVTDPALEGDVTLRFFIDDFEPDSHALAAFRNFSSTAVYVGGGSAAPQSSVLLLMGLGLAGSAGIARRTRRRQRIGR